MSVNDAQRKQWSDPATVANWERRELLTERVTRHVLGAALLQSGERVLEVGSGGGKLALLAGKQVSPRGHVTGADISQGMVELAAARAAAAKAKNVNFVVADCQSDKVPGGPFDAVISQFGVMFFEDPVAAFANIRAHLKRGARLSFACWQPFTRNPWFPGPVLARFLPPGPARLAPARPEPGPFAFGDPGYVRSILQEAGFIGIDRVAKTVTVRAPKDAIIDRSLAPRLNVPADVVERAMGAVDAHYETMRIPGTDLYRFELRIQVFIANSQG
jgi:SAM-dependent methyltransferase